MPSTNDLLLAIEAYIDEKIRAKTLINSHGKSITVSQKGHIEFDLSHAKSNLDYEIKYLITQIQEEMKNVEN